MKKSYFFLFLGMVLVVAVIAFGIRWFLAQKKPALAALQVTAVPRAIIFLEGEHLGKTPFYDEKLKPGEYLLKILPEGSATESALWQVKIKLNPGVLTAVNRIFGQSQETSSGEVLTLEKIGQKKAEVALLSTPDGAMTKLDKVDQGTTPLILREVTVSDHEITVSYPGFEERVFRIRTVGGYKLIANVWLAQKPKEETSQPVATESAQLQARVKILETPTGWLRVRTDPSLSASETAKIKPGQTHLLLEEKPGWFKIQYEEGKEGWISSQYATKI